MEFGQWREVGSKGALSTQQPPSSLFPLFSSPCIPNTFTACSRPHISSFSNLKRTSYLFLNSVYSNSNLDLSPPSYFLTILMNNNGSLTLSLSLFLYFSSRFIHLPINDPSDSFQPSIHYLPNTFFTLCESYWDPILFIFSLFEYASRHFPLSRLWILNCSYDCLPCPFPFPLPCLTQTNFPFSFTLFPLHY